MSYLGSWKIDDVLTIPLVTHTAAGAATAADAAPSYRVYEDATTTAIVNGTFTAMDQANTTSGYYAQLTLSAANGYEKGKSYSVYVKATVSTIVGAQCHSFQIQAEAAVASMNTNVLTASAINADAITAAKIADGAIDAATFAANAITSTVLADNAITAAKLATDAITAAKIADNAIDAATFAASALDAVWSTAARTLTAGTNIQLPSNGLANVVAWTVAITGSLSGSVGSVTGNVGGNVVGSVASVAGAVGSVTGNVGGNVVGSVASVAAGGIAAASFAANAIDSAALAASAVSEIQSGLSSLDAAGVRAAIGMTSANLDTQLAALAALIPSANTNADALLDRGDAIESSYTVRQALRLVLSVLAGPSSGLDGTTATYRDVNDGKNRVIATIDADGNRSGMTYDVT